VCVCVCVRVCVCVVYRFDLICLRKMIIEEFLYQYRSLLYLGKGHGENDIANESGGRVCVCVCVCVMFACACVYVCMELFDHSQAVNHSLVALTYLPYQILD
jgi:hypothetical protein